MEDLDDVLQAQKRLTDITDELARAKKAATLLENAQEEKEKIIESAEAVIEASEEVTEHAGEFAGEGIEIIRGLKAMNLEQRLGDLSREIAETQQLMGRQLDRLNKALEQLIEPEDLSEAHEKTQQQVQSSAEETQETVHSTVQALSDRLAELLSNIPEHFQHVHQRQQQQLERTEEQRQSAQRRHQSAQKQRRALLWMGGANAVLLLALLVFTLLS